MVMCTRDNKSEKKKACTYTSDPVSRNNTTNSFFVSGFPPSYDDRTKCGADTAWVPSVAFSHSTLCDLAA